MSNPILKKELQLLKGPIWAGLALFGFMLILMIPLNAKFLPTWMAAPFGLLLCYLITAAFGHELGDRLLATWVMQPKSRRELWRLKLKSLAMVYGTIWLLIGMTGMLTPIHVDHTPSETLSWSSMVPTFQFWALWLPWMCFGPGIYFTLKLRNPTASFWLTGAIPIMFIPVVLFVFNLISSITGTTFSTPLALALFVFLSLAYGAWGLWAARKQFLHWEDLGLEGKAIEFRLRKTSSTKTQADAIPPKRRSWWSAIWMRELRLQQINILAGFVLLAATWATYYWHQSMVTNGKSGDEVDMIGLLPTVFRYLLFILPSSIAAMSVADIRRQDAHTWELMLPVSKRFQFIIKMLSCLLLGWLFAAGLPFTFDKQASFVSTYETDYQNIALLVISIAAFVASAVSFYISSLTSTFLKSFSFSLGLTPLMAFYIAFIYALANAQHNFFILGAFVVPTGVALVLSLLCLWWSQSNFTAPIILKNHKTQNWKRWGLTFVTTMLWIGIMIDRSWERVILIEPSSTASEALTVEQNEMDDWGQKHFLTPYKQNGTNQSRMVIRSTLGNRVRKASIALASNGRLYHIDPKKLSWYGYRKPAEQPSPPKRIVINHEPENSDSALPAEVSETESSHYHRYILDLSGGLWMWDLSEDDRYAEEPSPYHRPILPKRLAEAHRFRNLTSGFNSVSALDENDNLWHAEYVTDGNSYSGDLTEFRKTFPEHQWKQIGKSPVGMVGIKVDGTMWGWKNAWVNLGKTKEETIDMSTPSRLFEGKLWKSIHPQNKLFLAEDKEGSLWIPTHEFFRNNSNSKIPNLVNRILCKVELPGLFQYTTHDRNRFGQAPFYWIRDDGTLWKSEFVFENLDININQPIIAKPIKSVQIGQRNDWVCLTFSAGMTADGKIWNWDRPQLNPWNPFPARFRHKVVADLGR